MTTQQLLNIEGLSAVDPDIRLVFTGRAPTLTLTIALSEVQIAGHSARLSETTEDDPLTILDPELVAQGVIYSNGDTIDPATAMALGIRRAVVVIP